LIAAGIELKEVKVYATWTREKVIRFIQRLHEKGVPLDALNSGSVRKMRKGLIAEVSREILGKEVSGATLINAAWRLFGGGWDEALSEAGFDPQEIKKPDPIHRALVAG
jgi:hypothetical protein